MRHKNQHNLCKRTYEITMREQYFSYLALIKKNTQVFTFISFSLCLWVFVCMSVPFGVLSVNCLRCVLFVLHFINRLTSRVWMLREKKNMHIMYFLMFLVVSWIEAYVIYTGCSYGCCCINLLFVVCIDTRFNLLSFHALRSYVS